MPNYPYRVRVLAVIDGHGGRPIELSEIESKLEAECNKQDVILPSTWKKWTKTTLDKLAEEGWLTSQSATQYTSTETLRKFIRDAKTDLRVPLHDHSWKTLAAISRLMPVDAEEVAALAQSQSTRKRKNVTVAVEVATPPGGSVHDQDELSEDELHTHGVIDTPGQMLPPPRPASTQTTETHITKKRRIRHSEPGLATRRESATTSTSTIRRRRSAPLNANRRHTLGAPISPSRFTFTQPGTVEMQFIPLRQVLTARTKRSLRRNQLSDEMNAIDAERRLGIKRNRDELLRLREELAESARKLVDLERALQAARMAPPSETASVGGGGSVGMAPIYEDAEENDGVTPQLPAFGTPTPSRTPFRFGGGLLTPALRRFQNEANRDPAETPISRRDKRIKDLEGQIENLRQDIVNREEEEKKRAEEEEMYREAQSQLFYESTHAMDTSNASFSEDILDEDTMQTSFNETPRTRKSQRLQQSIVEEISDDDTDEDIFEVEQDTSGFAPPQEQAEDDLSDNEMHDATNSGLFDDDDATLTSSRMFNTTHVSEKDAEVIKEVVSFVDSKNQLEQENETLQVAIGALRKRVVELEEQVVEVQMRPAERTCGVQTEPTVDAEKEKMKDLIVMLEDKADVLEQQTVEERNRLWQKIRGHLTSSHEREGEEELDMAIDEILTNLALAQNTADEHQKASEIALRDLKVEKMLTAEKEAEVTALQTEKQSLLAQIEELQQVRAELEEHMADVETEEEMLRGEIEDQRAELSEEQILLESKSEELDAALAEAARMERDVEELGDIIDEEMRDFDKPSTGAVTVLEKLQAFAEATRSERNTLQTRIEDLTQRLEDTEDALAEKEDKLLELDAKYAALTELEEKYQDLIEAKDKEIEELKAEIDELKEQLEEAQKTNDMLNGVIEQKNVKITSLTDQLTWLTNDLTKLREKRNEAQEEVKKLTARLEETQGDAHARGIRLDSELVARDQEITALNVRIAQLNGEISNWEEKLTESERQIEQLEKELAESREELDAQLDENEKQVEELNEQLDKKAEEIAGLQDNLRSMNDEIVELTSTITNLNEEQRSTRDKVSELQAAVQEKQSAIEELNKLNEVVNGVVEHKSKTIEGLLGEIDTLKAAKQEASTTIHQLKNQTSTLNQNISSHLHTITSLQTEIHELHSQIQSKESQISSLTTKNKKMEDENVDHTVIIDKLKAQFAEKDGLETSIRREVAELESQLEEHDEVITSLRAELAELKTTLDDKSNLEVKLRDELSLLRQDAQSKATLITKLETDVHEHENEIKKLTVMLQSAEDKLQESNETVGKLNKEIAALTKEASERDQTIGFLTHKADTTADRVKERDATIVELKRQVADRNGVIQVNAGTIESLQAKLKGLNVNLEEKNEVIQNLEDNIEDFNKDLIELNTRLEQIEDEKTAVENRVTELLGIVETRDKSIADLQKLYDVITQKNDDIADLQAVIESASVKYAAFKKKAEEELSALQDKYKTATEHSEELATSLGHEQEKNKELTVVQEHTKHKLHGTAQKLAISLEQQKTLTGRVTTLQEDLDGYKQLTDELKANIKELKHNLSEKDNIIARRDAQVFDLEDKLAVMETAMAEQLEVHDEALKELAAKKDLEIARLVKENETLIEQHQDTVKEYNSQLKKLAHQVTKLEGDVTASESETIAVRETMEALEIEKNKLVAELEAQLDALRKEKAAAQVHFEHLLKEKEEALAAAELKASQDIDELKMQLSAHQTEVASYEAKLKHLQTEYEYSVLEESHLNSEIKMMEEEAEALEEGRSKLQLLLDERTTEYNNEIEILRGELHTARDEVAHQMDLHAADLQDKAAVILGLNNTIDALRAETLALRERVDAVTINSKHWESRYHAAVDDAAARFDEVENNLWKAASRAKENKAEFLKRSTARALEAAEERKAIERQTIEVTKVASSSSGAAAGQAAEQQLVHVGGGSTASEPEELLSVDATTNVSTLLSPPTPDNVTEDTSIASEKVKTTTVKTTTTTTTATAVAGSKRRRFDSGIGIEGEGVEGGESGSEEGDENMTAEERERYGKHGGRKSRWSSILPWSG